MAKKVEDRSQEEPKRATKSNERAADSAPAASARLKPPPGGAAVRMYRIGHGDCFLIAFAGEDPDKPAYVLIDCGYKPGSPGKLAQPTKVKEIGQHIIATTGGFVDVAIVTHEHQDHVNGLTPANFPGLKVGKVWFAWTENPKDDIANQLRKKFKDRLLGLIDARANLLGLGKNDAAETSIGISSSSWARTPNEFNGFKHIAAGGKDPAKSANKVAMKFLRDCAPGDPEYLYPHEKVRRGPGREERARLRARSAARHRQDRRPRSGRRREFWRDDGHGFGAAGGGAAAGLRKARRSRAAT